MKSLHKICIFFFVFLIASCMEPNAHQEVGDNIVYPGKLVAYGANRFLLLNTDAASEYKTGSIHRYLANAAGDPTLEHVFQVPSHGSDLVLSDDTKLLALSFDGSKKDTELFFYDYSNPNSPVLLNLLNLQFAAGGGKQTIKELKFFNINSSDEELKKYYYLQGVILNSPLDTGKGDRIPTRSFVVRISKDLTSSEILFVLSYGVGDESVTQALSPKSDSLTPTFSAETQYMIGSSAPVFDPIHNLFIAFPTGSMNGYNDTRINEYPELPFDKTITGSLQYSALQYFSGKQNGNVNCFDGKQCIQPDLRAVSVFVVDMVDYLKNHRDNVNASLYFTPLAWNLNGVPYNHQTKGGPLVLGGGDEKEIKSFTFQYNFWSSFMQNDGSILMAKRGENGEEDKDGNGNEIFRLSGLDTVAEYIASTKKLVEVTSDDAKDFKNISSRQVLDSFHVLNEPKFIERTKGLSKGNNLLVPYIYSRTTDDVSFKMPTAVYGFDTICTDTNTVSSCSTYWIRSSYLGFNGQGRDTSWLTIALPQEEYKPGTNPDFPDAVQDPSAFTSYEMPQMNGAYVCTTLAQSTVYCASFLTGEFMNLSLTPKGFQNTQ